MEKKSNKILYLHGRPSAHPLHASFARAVGSKFYYVDNFFPWQDKSKSLFYRVLSSIINAFTYPINNYNLILVDNLHFSPIIAKLIRPFSKKKYIVHLGSHTLYFMYTGKFSSAVTKIHIWALKRYDYLICEGNMAKEIVTKIAPELSNKCFVTFLGPTTDRSNRLKKNIYNAESKNILIIAGGPGKFREFYKGLDLMIECFSLLTKHHTEYKLKIVGKWSEETKNDILSKLNQETINSVSFIGHVENISPLLEDAVLLFHCSRGDAFPTSTIEAMAAGVPALVSEWTGTKEIVEKIDSNLVVKLDKEQILNALIRFLLMDASKKKELSSKFRKHADFYTEENACLHYKKTIEKILNTEN